MSLFWIAAGVIAAAGAVAAVVYVYLADRKYLRQKTSESFSPALREEIEEEREESLERRKKFEEVLSRAKDGKERRY